MPNSVVHFEIVGPDGPRLREFYTSMFDWKLEVYEAMNYGLVQAGEGGIGGGIGGTDQGSHVTVYVQVPDLQAALDRAEQLGGKTIMPPTHVMDGVDIANFADPDGHIIGLIKR